MKRALLLAVLLLVVTACSNRRGAGEDAAEEVPLPENMPMCTEGPDALFADGKTIDRAQFGKACKVIDEKGKEEMAVPRPVRLTCTDNTVLTWNNFAWGYEAKAMTMRDPSASAEDIISTALDCQAG